MYGWMCLAKCSQAVMQTAVSNLNISAGTNVAHKGSAKIHHCCHNVCHKRGPEHGSLHWLVKMITTFNDKHGYSTWLDERSQTKIIGADWWQPSVICKAIAKADLHNAAAICNNVWCCWVNCPFQSNFLLQQVLHRVQYMIQHHCHPHLHSTM